jgi:hypothetical protein
MPLPLGDEAGDLAARLEARIDELIEPRQRRAVILESALWRRTGSSHVRPSHARSS